MPKKIKSFTVDEEVYNSLVSMFQRYKTGVSVSLYINKMLQRLLNDLKELEDALNKSSLTVTMDYIINKIVTGINEKKLEYPQTWNDRIKEKEEAETRLGEMISVTSPLDELGEWQTQYDAEKKGIPYELYKYTTDGTMELSGDKRYLILKMTGERFFPIGGRLMKLVDENK